MMAKKPNLTRRDFIKASAVALGSATLACGLGEQVVEIKGTVTPDPNILPAPTLGLGEAADTVLFNGNLITMDEGIPSAEAVAVKGTTPGRSHG